MHIGYCTHAKHILFPYRAAKASAVKLISDSILVTPRGRKEEEEDESDDSLVGDHSPFVRQPARRCVLRPIRV